MAYSINTMHGDEICDGLESFGQAQTAAQRHANRRGESVYIFGEDLGEDGYEVEPE